MATNAGFVNGPDSIVMAVLDHLVEISQIYPPSVFPDSLVRKDLELTDEQIQDLTDRLALTLGLEDEITFLHVEDFTLRDLVVKLKQLYRVQEQAQAS